MARTKKTKGAGRPRTPWEVLEYFLDADRVRRAALDECRRLAPELIAEARKRLKVATRDELAEVLETGPTYLSGIVAGRVPPGPDLLRRLGAAIESGGATKGGEGR